MKSKVEQQVMASVAVIYAVRTLVGRTALSCYTLAASGLMLWQLVWVSKIVENFSLVGKGGLAATVNYVLYAVSHTQVAVQLTLLVAAAAAIALIVDTARSSTTPHTFTLRA